MAFENSAWPEKLSDQSVASACRTIALARYTYTTFSASSVSAPHGMHSLLNRFCQNAFGLKGETSRAFSAAESAFWLVEQGNSPSRGEFSMSFLSISSVHTTDMFGMECVGWEID